MSQQNRLSFKNLNHDVIAEELSSEGGNKTFYKKSKKFESEDSPISVFKKIKFLDQNSISMMNNNIKRHQQKAIQKEETEFQLREQKLKKHIELYEQIQLEKK